MTPIRLGRWSEPAWPGGYRELFLEHVRDTVLGFWERAVDPEGGFFTDLDRRGRPNGPQRRFVVHVARLVWAFAAAHRFGLGDGRRYLELAERAATTLDRLWDPDRGGWGQETDRAGSVLDASHSLYGLAFGLYATAELALASGAEAARRRAVEAADLLTGTWRSDRGGFLTGRTGDGDPTGEDPDPNAHIHVMEAMVPLLELTGEGRHRDLLREARDLVRDRMVVPAGAGGMMLADRLDASWRPAPGPRGHTERYGHGIETAWLLLQAAEALGEPVGRSVPVARALVDRAVEVGLDRRWGGMFFDGTVEAGPLDRRKIWWVQAEALVALVRLAAETGDPAYVRRFREQAAWIVRRQADRHHGEWFAILRRRGLVQDGRKSHRWKSAYHTTRACLETARLLSAPPFAPDG